MRVSLSFLYPAALVMAFTMSGGWTGAQTASLADGASAARDPVAIPKVEASADWSAQAHVVRVLTPSGEGSFQASLAVAWTPTDLLVEVRSTDADVNEDASEGWRSDSVDIVMAASPGSDDEVSFTCIPGRTSTSQTPRPQWRDDDKRASPPPVAAPTMQTFADKGAGYRMRIALPWANLKHVPLPDDIIGLQVRINDAHADGTAAHRVWYSGPLTGKAAMNAVLLADHASPPEEAAAWIANEGLQDVVHVSASPALAGQKVELFSGADGIAATNLQAGGVDESNAMLALPEAWAEKSGAALDVSVNGRILPSVLAVPNMKQKRLDLAKDSPLATHFIFDGDKFPPIDFDHRDLVEAAVGPYTLHTRFFDGQWNEVTVPKQPGRYGALVEFRSQDGATFTRHVTLFKTPQKYVPGQESYAASFRLPSAFGLPAGTADRQQWIIKSWIDDAVNASARRSDDSASVLAALHDIADNPGQLDGFNAWQIDMDWWSELNKRLGENQDYLHLTHLPDGYDKDQKSWPLILFLHGSGERGNDLSRLRSQGPLGFINKGHTLPFIVVEPLCPEEESWNPGRLARLLDQIEATNRVDPKRIYVTGLSLGGFGTLDLAATYPERIAAIAPLSGGENPDLAARLKHMPTWFFHGAEDDVVSPSYSIDLAHAMEKIGAPVKLTVIPGVGHGDWDVTYADPALYAWFLQHSK